MMSTTTIQISEELHRELANRKIFERETYEEVIWSLMEDSQELSEQTKKELALAREDIGKGRSHKLSDVKKELGL